MVYKEKICKLCMKKYQTQSGCSKYCSKECFVVARKEWLKNDEKNNPKKYIERRKLYHQTRINKNIEKGIVPLLRRKKICSICNNKFILNNGNSMYCSDKCRKKIDNIRHKEFRKKFPNKASIIDRKMYINFVGYNPRKKINCVVCDEVFVRNSIRSNYCNKKECKLKYLSDKALKNYYINKENGNIYYIKLIIGNRLRAALKAVKTKKNYFTKTFLGCNVDILREHLSNQFKDGMTWKNYGKWHIDHIKPCCSFDLTKEEEQKECFHYTNLQPLWARENLSKGAKINESI